MKTKLKSNVLYKVIFIFDGIERWGVGFAYNLGEEDLTTIGLSLPDGGIANIVIDDIISIEVYNK
jgi:hypothetical protein